ncbi:hypothetical protein [Thiogranum longum]|uniref:hypothetical protein n=1 Tax=Thiogranum longum TaxID=1537524 RepID=UPI001401D86C|nr:hypothetical protein [Thiogranum longum]
MVLLPAIARWLLACDRTSVIDGGKVIGIVGFTDMVLKQSEFQVEENASGRMDCSI